MAAPFVLMSALLTIILVAFTDTKATQVDVKTESTQMVNYKRHVSKVNHVKDKTEVCIGSNITLGWDQSLSRGKQVEVVKWFFTPRNTSKSVIIATFAHGILATIPAYSSRLNHLGQGNFVLSEVMPSDAGTYMAEIITMQKKRSFFVIHRELVVTVAVPASYSSNNLTLKMDQHAVLVNKMNRKLANEDPEDVEQFVTSGIMETPSGSKVKSTHFKNGLYFLRLDNPVEDGVYSCRLEPRAVTALCLQADDRLLSEASLRVNAVDIRLALLEGEQQRLKGELKRVKGALEEYGAFVGFHARLSNNIILRSPGQSIVFRTVLLNTGSGYNSTTGIFTARLTGTYFIVFRVSSFRTGYYSNCRLYVNGNRMSYTFATYNGYYNPTSGHALVHLNRGNQVWLEPDGSNRAFSSYSLFTGFLVHADVSL